MISRTDRHNNPAAITSDLAAQAGLVLNKDYTLGDQFEAGNNNLYTAKLLHDPIDLTIQVIDKVGFYTQKAKPRWIYIGMPLEIWLSLNPDQKKLVIHFMYKHEGGSLLEKLFA